MTEELKETQQPLEPGQTQKVITLDCGLKVVSRVDRLTYRDYIRFQALAQRDSEGAYNWAALNYFEFFDVVHS